MRNDLTVSGSVLPPLPRTDYTLGLLHRAAEQGLIPDSRLLEIRRDLQTAVQERANMYTAGRSNTVTATQAKAFYDSILHQLDAVLILSPDDAAATDALRSRPLKELLDAGQQRILALFAQAKEDFRAAYNLHEPFMTDLFRQLLKSFSSFITEYDARYHANAQIADRVYPLIGGRQIPESGILGTSAYYRALRREGEFLQVFPADAVLNIMQRHANRYLMTVRSMPDSAADLAFRQFLAAEMAQEDGFSLAVTGETVQRLTSEFAGRPAAELRLEAELSLGRFSEHKELYTYLKSVLPSVITGMQHSLDTGVLQRWLVLTES